MTFEFRFFILDFVFGIFYLGFWVLDFFFSKQVYFSIRQCLISVIILIQFLLHITQKKNIFFLCEDIPIKVYIVCVF